MKINAPHESVFNLGGYHDHEGAGVNLERMATFVKLFSCVPYLEKRFDCLVLGDIVALTVICDEM